MHSDPRPTHSSGLCGVTFRLRSHPCIVASLVELLLALLLELRLGQLVVGDVDQRECRLLLRDGDEGTVGGSACFYLPRVLRVGLGEFLSAAAAAHLILLVLDPEVLVARPPERLLELLYRLVEILLRMEARHLQPLLLGWIQSDSQMD